MTVISHARGPPYFLLRHGRLFQQFNDSMVFHVNVKNATNILDIDEHPLQLELSLKRGGITRGYWAWRGTMLFYEAGQQGNQGTFYHCPMRDGTMGLFMFLQP